LGQNIRLDTQAAGARLELPQTPLDRGLEAAVRWLAGEADVSGSHDVGRSNRAMEIGQR
jgi:hypothetical protein